MDCITKILQRHFNNPDPSFEDIKTFYDENLHPDAINLGDQEVYKNIFHNEKWIGIFQFTEAGAQRFASQVKPTSIVDLAAITSIYRPGPLSAGVDKAYTKAVEEPHNGNESSAEGTHNGILCGRDTQWILQ